MWLVLEGHLLASGRKEIWSVVLDDDSPRFIRYVNCGIKPKLGKDFMNTLLLIFDVYDVNRS